MFYLRRFQSLLFSIECTYYKMYNSCGEIMRIQFTRTKKFNGVHFVNMQKLHIRVLMYLICVTRVTKLN